MELLCVVVEDDSALQAIYDFILKREGYRVLFARNGQDALTTLANHQPHLVFLDMRLPMMSGLEVLEYARSQPHLAQTQFVVVSSQETYRRQVGDVPFLLKPVEPSQLAQIAQQIRAMYADTM